MLGVLARAIVYVTLFVGSVLVYLPARTAGLAGLDVPPAIGPWQVVGGVATLAGAVLAAWCVATFIVVGRGTPAPFDPPRQLVTRGPYRFVRNPMYVGAALALGGAAVVYRSTSLLAYVVTFLAVAHVFIISYEERTLRRTFGPAYEAYRRDVPRWCPRWPRDTTVSQLTV